MRSVLIAALASALALLPCHRAQAQATNDPQPKVFMEVACGIIVIGVGIWVTYELHKVCKKLLDPPPANGGTNAPPPGPEFLTYPAPTPGPGPALTLTDAAVSYVESDAGWPDPVTGSPVTATMAARLESSADLHQWREEYQLTGWVSDTGIQVLYARGGIPVLTNYLAFGATNCVPLSVGTGSEPKKFFRLLPL